MSRSLRGRLDRVERSMPPEVDPDEPIPADFWHDLNAFYGDGTDPGPPPSRAEFDRQWKAAMDEVYGTDDAGRPLAGPPG